MSLQRFTLWSIFYLISFNQSPFKLDTQLIWGVTVDSVVCWEFFQSVDKIHSWRKQSTFRDATTSFPAKWSTKWRRRNEHRNSILMTCHYPDLGRASLAVRPIRSTTRIWVVTRHQYGISASVRQSFCGEIFGVAKWRLFSQANKLNS